MSTAPLVLVLEFSRSEQAEDPYSFRFEPQDYQLRSAGGGVERARFEWDQALLSDLEALRQPACDPAVQARLGERLRRFVTPLGWPELAAQLQQAMAAGRTVILTVRSAAAELYALPWELLPLKASGQHVGELSAVLLRYEWPETHDAEERPQPRRGGGRILLAWSAAGGAVPAAEHMGAAGSACHAGLLPFAPQSDVLAHASISQLGAALSAAKRENRPISVVHLLCHGGQSGSTFGLLLNGAADHSEIVDAARLRQVLGPHADMVRLVVLMACDSGNSGRLGNALGSIAQTLHRAGIESVIASRYPLSVAGSICVARSLYASLLVELQSLEGALRTTRNALIQGCMGFDWASLQLYARGEDRADTRPILFRPYPGLAAFDDAHRRFYFGREALTADLWKRCQELAAADDATRLLAVMAPSGFGKSSVVRAGLVPEVERQPLEFAGPQADEGATRVAILRPGAHPLAALAAALPSDDTAAPLLLIVDQFEEIYSLCRDSAERDAFVGRLLKDASAREPRVLVVLTLRTDFLGETGRYHPQLNRLFGKQAQLVTAMSSEDLRSAIARPAERLGRPLDEATIDLLLEQVQGREGALPLLSFALSQLWEGVLCDKACSETLQEIGGVGGALAQRAHALYGSLDSSEQATARRALVRLVQLGEGTRDTRRRVSVRELCGRGQTADDVLAVLRKLATENARLVTLFGDGVGAVAEVTHEALFDHWSELRQWIDQSRADRRFHDRVSETARLWDEAGRPAGRLWRSPDLDLLRSYKRNKPEELSPLQDAFLRSSEQQQQRERVIRWGSVAAIFAALIVAAAIYITKERQRADEERKRAQEEQKRTEAVAEAGEQIRQKLLDTYVEQGRQLLLETGSPSEAALWLHRARARRSTNPALPDLLRDTLFAVESTQAVLVGHTQEVRTAAFSPDGKRVVTASYDGTARVWDANSGGLLATLKGHESKVMTAAFSPDGKRVVTASLDSTARVWDAGSGSLLATLEGHAYSLWTAAYSPDGKRIVTASNDKTARIWDAESGRLLVKLEAHVDRVLAATYSPDGTRVVTVSTDDTAAVWDADSGRVITVLKGHRDGINAATYSPDGKRIATASADGGVGVWDADSGRVIAVLKGHRSGVWDVHYSPDGKRIVSASDDATVGVWDATNGDLLGTLKGHRSRVLTAVYSPDGKRILSASLDSSARVWAADTGHPIAELKGHQDDLLTAAFSPDGKRIVTASNDHTARVWQMDSARLFDELEGHEALVIGATYSPDGKRIVTASKDGTVRVWDADSRRKLTVLASGKPSINPNITPFSPDSKRVVTACGDFNARVWETDSGRMLVELTGHEQGVNTAAFSSDGKRIVTASFDRTVRVWEADSGRVLAVLKGPESLVMAATFSHDGKLILTTSNDNTARVWEADSGRLLVELKGHADTINAATFSPKGTRIVTASDDNTARIWESDSGRSLAILKGHRDKVVTARFSPDGKYVVTASHDNTARVWETNNGGPFAELMGHTSRVISASYNSEGTRIVTASNDGTARVWEASSGRLLGRLQGYGATVLSAAYSPDGQHIVTGSYDNLARVWSVVPESRAADEIGKMLRCKVTVRFASEDNNVIVPTLPNPAECLPPPSP